VAHSSIVQFFEAHQRWRGEYRANYDAVPPLLRGRLDQSLGITPAAYDEARAIANRPVRHWRSCSSEVDVLLTFRRRCRAQGTGFDGDARFNRSGP